MDRVGLRDSSDGPPRERQQAGDQWLVGGGEMGELIRSMDWSRTPLGPLKDWPHSLRTTVNLCLSSNFPINILWGPKSNQIYNDGYRVIVGEKHPEGMGMSYKECWESAWPEIGGPFEKAWSGQTSFIENQRMFLTRSGYLEETFFTFSLSPIRDERGVIVGLFHPVTETTTKMLSERRTRTLRELAANTSEARSLESAFTRCAETFSAHQLDLPFVLLYSLNTDGAEARLVARSGIEAGLGASPDIIDTSLPGDGWPLRQILTADTTVSIDDLRQRFGEFNCGPYPEGANLAIARRLHIAGVEAPVGVIIAAFSPRLPLNQEYRDHLEQVTTATATALGNALAYEREQKRAEALAELDRSKTLFFSNVSHEFRTPLTLMLGPLEELLQQRGLTPQQREQLEVSHRNSLRLLKLVNTLLDFSRVEGGRIRANFEPTELGTYTAEIASNFRSACERAGIELIIACPPSAQPVYVDREMWEKIVLNLVSNAFKFTFEGSITVALEPHPDGIELAVKDTGTGIPADELPQIFQRFHRVRSGRARTHEGTGIGLALVQELIRLHGATIEVESELDRGTTFRTYLRYGKAHLPSDQIGTVRELASTAVEAPAFVEEALRWIADERSPALDASPGVGSIASRQTPAFLGRNPDADRARVLVVDDNTDMRDYLRRLLATKYQVLVAADGEKALQMVRAVPPDLVLADIMMPVLDGMALLNALRSDASTSAIPVILLSARAGEEAKVEGLEAGADDYLIKPFSARELMARVATNLEMAGVRREAAEAVRVSEERFRALTNASADVIYCMGPDWTEMRRLDGRGRLVDTPTPSQSWLEEYIALEDQADVWNAIQQAVRTKSVFELEHRVRLTDGTLGWTFSRAVPLLASDGEIVEWIGSASDITAKRQAEEALRRSEERLRRVLETDAVGVLFFDHEGTVIAANDVFLRLTGYTHAEIECHELTWRRMTPADWIQESERQMAVLEATGRLGPYEKEYFLKDGSRRWMLFAGRDLGDGTISEFCMDISDQKRAEAALRESEQRFRLFVQNVQEYALFQTDAAGRVTGWNPGAERLFGYATTEMLGENISVLLAPEDRAAKVLDREMARVSADNERLEAAHWLVRKDGRRFWARWLAEPILDERGELRGIARILRDETERQRLEDAMRISLAEKEALLKEVHHRVKNNLHVIKSMLEMQARRTEDYSAFQQLQEAANRVISIAKIHEVLYQSGSFAGVDLAAYAGRLTPQLVALYNVQDRIEVAVEGESVSVDLERAVPCGLLLNELVSNTCKHAFPDVARGRLTVELTQVDDKIRLIVQDTGIGLPADFDVRNSDSLGMTIVRLLTDQLEGSIVVRNGAGTCVEVQFPASKPV